MSFIIEVELKAGYYIPFFFKMEHMRECIFGVIVEGIEIQKMLISLTFDRPPL